MSSKKYPKRWAMLAETYSEDNQPPYPCIAQPKLNGIRAMWTGTELVSRQRHIWNPEILPGIYKALIAWSKYHPNLSLDGEIYCHGMPFQLLAGIAAIHRNSRDLRTYYLTFNAFDLVDDTRMAEDRQKILKEVYNFWVPVGQIKTQDQIEPLLIEATKAGYEGLILRDPTAFYTEGKTNAMLKVKPWYELSAKIIAFREGEGKYINMLGALVVISTDTNRLFKVSGGINDELRDKIWRHQKEWLNRQIIVRYQELSLAGKPLKPQVKEL